MVLKIPHEERFKKDITENVAAVLNFNPGMNAERALHEVTKEMLANNPYVPPKGCPVNDLPNELLAYIFLVGTRMEEEGDTDDEEDEDEYAQELDLISDPKASLKILGFGPNGDESDEDTEDNDDEDDDEDEFDPVLPFQVLVSHVCRHWREIALESPALWTILNFSEGAPFEKSRVWLERSKGLPLDILIDCTIPEGSDDHPDPIDFDDAGPGAEGIGSQPPRPAGSHGQRYDEEHKDCEHPPPFFSLEDLSTILDLITPHVAHWRSLEVTASLYEYMHILLTRLAHCPAAPLLQVLELHHYEETEDYDTFQPTALNTAFLIFNGIAPNLSEVSLWGVHLDWERSLSFLSGLRDLELAYHARDVRPSFATFSKLLAASPNLRTLTLCLSGPADHIDGENEWTIEPLEVPSLKDLVLCYHDCKYITALMDVLSTPNIHSLALDFDEGDYTEFALRLTEPIRGKSKSILSGLEHLKIAGLPCNERTVDTIFEQLAGLHTLNLNCSGDEEIIFDRLMKSKSYCPNLHTITTTGIQGSKMRQFVEIRRAAGFPVKKVFMSEEDQIDEKEEKWLRANLDSLEFFEPSDSEEELIEIDEDDLDEDGGMDID
ncbi:hypothetical protein BDZ94DRAFT_1183403 [Collybia nuda]|uniref:F-box domain-containing protein n=1 Tax=Collybia nuda TaxID=64659 RepID=A0A9P5YH93_9AGAR|nr:hypothetical protein BDZ94DRAFT_1183403 [Collybia nuda]